MKKRLLPLIAATIVVILLPNIALALDLAGMMDKIKEAAWTIFLGLAIIGIIISAIMFLMAAGDPEKLSRAKKAFVWSIVGIAVGLAAGGLFTIIQGIVG